MSDTVQAVEIRAELRQIKTMADGTANVTLNVPEYCRPQVKAMLDWLHLEVGAVIVVAPVKNAEKQELQGDGTISRRAAKQRKR